MTAPSGPERRDAERSVLGSMLRDNEVIGEVVRVLRPDHFSTHAHRAVFCAITSLYEQSKAADLVTVAQVLRQRGQWEDAPPSLLAEFWDANPTAANALHHAQIVRDRALLRQLLDAGQQIVQDAMSPRGPAEEIIEAAEQRVFAVAEMGVRGTAVPLAEVLDRTISQIQARYTGEQKGGLAMGLADLDPVTGGLHPGELIILGARPSVGKTALALWIARHVALEEKATVFFASLEQSAEEIGERLLCQQSGVPSQRVRRAVLGADQVSLLDEARTALSAAKLHVDDTPGQSALSIVATARRLKSRQGLGLVVVDYLGLIDPENRRDKRNEQVALVSRRLKHLARSLRVPVLALAQLNREVEGRDGARPRLSDLRDSGDIEQNADVVFLLHEPPASPARLDVIVAKQRNGPKADISLRFERACYRFSTYAPDLNLE